jgi:carbonic anhydrase
VSSTDRLLDANEAFAASFDAGGLEAPPRSGVAVVTCMDARIDVYRALGLEPGDAHVIRNAGAVVTDEVIRSLAISQHKLGTTEVVLIGHTKCGMEGLDGDAFASQLDQTGGRRDWSIGAFEAVDRSVADGVAKIRESPFLERSESVRGFVYDVDSGRLEEVA